MELTYKAFDKNTSLEQQRKLFVECFPETIGTTLPGIEHYLWKFHSFPHVPASFEFHAQYNNEIVGYYAAIPYPYIYFHKQLTVGMVCDVMTGQNARGKGVFTRLGVHSTNQFQKAGLAFSTGYPIRPEVIPGHVKAGWDLPFKIPMYGKFLKMNAFLRSRNRKYLVPWANLFFSSFNAFLRLINFSRNNSIVKSYSSSDLDSIPGLEEFFTAWKNENAIALNKSIEFLKWRLNAPGQRYQIIVLKKDAKVVGYTILREVIRENIPCMGILDFSILNEYKQCTKILLKEIDAAAISAGSELILVMMMKHHAKKHNLFRNGFIKTPYTFSFIIKQYDQTLDKEELHNGKNWNLMWIDSDDL